jgi:hypothetical protein
MRPGQIDDVMDLFRGANVRMLWYVWPADRGLESGLLDRGLAVYEGEPAMVADLAVETSGPVADRHANPQYRDLEDLYVWVRILSESSNDTFIRHLAELRSADDRRTAPVRGPARSRRRPCRCDGRSISANASRTGSARRDRAQSPEARHRPRDDGRCTRARPPPRRSRGRTKRVAGRLWHLRAPRLRDRPACAKRLKKATRRAIPQERCGR